MTDARTTWPPLAVEHRLAEHLLAGTPPTTPSEIAAAYLAPLTAYLRAARPEWGEDECATAAEDAIIGVCRGSVPYESTGLPLGAFLRFVAGRRVPPSDWKDEGTEPRLVAAVAVRG